MSRNSTLPKRKRIITNHGRLDTGHEVVRIAERLPGIEPTDASINLTDGPSYEARYWRCLDCGSERNHLSAFTKRCTAELAVVANGGYSIEEARTQAALTEEMHIRAIRAGYEVTDQSGTRHRVDLGTEHCSCSEQPQMERYCKHLRRVDMEVRAGLVPDIDR